MFFSIGKIKFHITKAFIKRSPDAPKYFEVTTDSCSIELYALKYYMLITME